MKTIDLTNREIDLLITAVGTHVQELMKEPPESCLPTPGMAALINELDNLRCDLRALVRKDQWHKPVNPHVAQAIDNEAEAQFIQAGIDAREMKKARAVQAFGDSDMRLGSMAAQRRAAERSVQRMMQGTATPVIVEEDE